MKTAFGFLTVATALGVGAPAFATVTEYTDRSEWEAAVGDFTTIDFVFDEPTLVTDQYLDQGVLFPDPDDTAYPAASFLLDGWGITGGPTDLTIDFLSPQAWIAVDFPGGVQFDLFYQGELLYTSSEFGISGAGHFAGLDSSMLFDSAVLRDLSGNVNVDDLHFGVPAPPSIALLAMGMLSGARGRSRCRRPCMAFRLGRPI